MPESMSWWNGAWRETSELSVYSGSTWLTVSEAWIWDGSAWRRCFVGGGVLSTVSVVNTFGATIEVSWTYTAAVPSQWLMTFEVSFNFGSSWQTVDTSGDLFVDDSRNPFEIALDSLFGYTDVADTYVRVSMRRSGAHATGSPNTQFPPF